MPAVRRRLAPIALAACVLVVGACGGNTVSKGEIAKQIQASYARNGFTAPVRSVDCPKDLDAKVGKAETCTLTYKSGHAFAVSATIKTVKGSTAHFGFVVTKRLK